MLIAVERAILSERNPRALARLRETLAKHHDRLGNFGVAAHHAGRANALMKELAPRAEHYDQRQHEDRVDSLIRNKTTQLFQRLRGAGSQENRLVFVIGLPRSGTTLLEQMLASHPGIIGVGEQSFAEAAWKRALDAPGGSHETLAATAIEASAAWHLQMLESRVRRLGIQAHGNRIVDKMPDNYLMAGWLHLAFPKAAIIHCRGDPRDVAVSCWLTQFGDTQWINDLRTSPIGSNNTGD
jgi:hypothetical protein